MPPRKARIAVVPPIAGPIESTGTRCPIAIAPAANGTRPTRIRPVISSQLRAGRLTPSVASIPTAATQMPYTPASLSQKNTAMAMSSTGAQVDAMPFARPAMMLVAAPVVLCSAIDCAGRRFSEV